MAPDFGPLKAACERLGVTPIIEVGVVAPSTNEQPIPDRLQSLAPILQRIAEAADQPITIKFDDGQ